MKQGSLCAFAGLAAGAVCCGGAFAGEGVVVSEAAYGAGGVRLIERGPDPRGIAGESATIAIDLETVGLQGYAGNGRLAINVDLLVGSDDTAVDVSVTQLAWALNIETVSPSWLAESSLRITGESPADGLTLTPGGFDQFPGTAFYADGPVDFSTFGLPNIELDAGFLYIEAFEVFDDFFGDTPESRITGVLTIWTDHVGPTPCSPADLSLPLDTLDLADLVAFIEMYLDEDPAADLAAPMGVFDLADLTAFVDFFTTGCP